MLMFEGVVDFSDFWTVLCEDCQFFVFVFILFLVDFFCICTFRFAKNFSRKLFCAMACIVFHSICCLSVFSGSDCILVIWYR